MKKLLLFILLMPIISEAQVSYSTQTSYKHDKVDGWVRIIESQWFTINGSGDTTYWTETKEDTQQEDPGIKKDTVAVLIPNSVFKIGEVPPEPKPEPIYYRELVNNTATLSDYLLSDTISLNHYKTITKHTSKTKVKARTKYKDKWHKKKKSRRPRQKKEKPEPPAQPLPEIKAITYDQKLWVAVKANGSVLIVEAKNKQEVIKKIASPYISITQFSEGSILR